MIPKSVQRFSEQIMLKQESMMLKQEARSERRVEESHADFADRLVGGEGPWTP
jgi:hypothetical protein